MRLQLVFGMYLGLCLGGAAQALTLEGPSPNLMAEIAHSKQWLAILQLQQAALGGWNSFVDKESKFFFSGPQRLDPSVELRNFLVALRSDEKIACRFPARTRYLSERLRFPLVLDSCQELSAWRNKLKASRLELVFAAQFIGSPSSVMGHTFLNFRDDRREHFLAESVNFSAELPVDVRIFDYFYKGLTGGFEGKFDSGAYYEKVQEYSNIERRDLWEFELKLSGQQRSALVDHIWELKNEARIPYKFLRENCSYVLLSAIQGVVPDAELIGGFFFYAAPLETVKKLDRAGLLGHETFRASSSAKLRAGYSSLGSGEKKEVRVALRSGELTGEALSAPALDVLLDALALERYEEEDKSGNGKQLEQKVLLKRAELGAVPGVEVARPESPLLSHGPQAISLGMGNSANGGEFAKLSYRYGVHDFEEVDTGYLENSSFNVGKIELKYPRQRKRIELSEFQVLDLGVLTEFSRIDFSPAWRARLRYREADASARNEGHFLQVEGEIGSLWVIAGPVQAALLANIDYRPWLTKGSPQFWAGPKGVVILRPSKRWKWVYFLKPAWEWVRSAPAFSLFHNLEGRYHFSSIYLGASIEHQSISPRALSNKWELLAGFEY